MTIEGRIFGLKLEVEQFLKDKEHWLPCSVCGEPTPYERYVVGTQACISCSNINVKWETLSIK